MKFFEMKTCADLQEEFVIVCSTIEDLKQKSDSLFNKLKQSCHDDIVMDFCEYFNRLGFETSAKPDEASALYKTIKICLIVEEPGRRTDDIPCVLRCRMNISSLKDENYSVYAQWSDSSPASPLPVDAIMTPDGKDAHEVIIQFQNINEKLEELVYRIESARNHFKHKLNSLMLQNLLDAVHDMQSQIKQQILKWTETHNGNLSFLVSKDQDDWRNDISSSHSSITEFLTNLDKGQ